MFNFFFKKKNNNMSLLSVSNLFLSSPFFHPLLKTLKLHQANLKAIESEAVNPILFFYFSNLNTILLCCFLFPLKLMFFILQGLETDPR